MRVTRMIAVTLATVFVGSVALAQSSVTRSGSVEGDVKDPDVALESGWRLCNLSDYDDVYVTYSFYADGEWLTKGWRRIDYGRCEVFQRKITNKTAYYYAISGNEKAQWDGDINLCAHKQDKFEYYGDVENCTGDYKLFPFYALDLSGQTSVTRNLTSN